MPSIKISLSAAPVGFEDFLSMCLTLASSLAGHDVSGLKDDFKLWYKVASRFTASYGIRQEFKTVCLQFLRTMIFTEAESMELAVILKEKMPEFQRDISISKAQLGLLRNVVTYCRKDSDAALRGMIKNVSILHRPQLNATFVRDSIDTGAVAHDATKDSVFMRNTVTKLTDRKDMFLLPDEMKKLSEEDPTLKDKYVAARKRFNVAYKHELQSFVRRSGKTMVPIKEVQAYLKGKGCDGTMQGFVGFIDDAGVYYTAAHKKVKGVLIGRVRMNPNYDPDSDSTYVCSMYNDSTRGLRTVAFLQANKSAKFEVVRELAKNIGKFRAKWLRQLKSADPRQKRLATIVETVYVTAARIGGAKNKANGEATYGIATFHKKHMKITPSKITINYPGKKGTMQPGAINKATNKVLYDNLVEAYNEADDTTPVLAYNGIIYASAQVNRYMRNTIGTPKDSTIHMIRHVHATSLALSVIEKCKFKKGIVSQSEAQNWYKNSMKVVGEALHHQNGGNVTGTTAITSYIDPKISQDFFTDLGLHIPDWVPTEDKDE